MILYLVNLVFANPAIRLEPLQHVESFAGEMSVTLAEWQDHKYMECKIVGFVLFSNFSFLQGVYMYIGFF